MRDRSPAPGQGTKSCRLDCGTILAVLTFGSSKLPTKPTTGHGEAARRVKPITTATTKLKAPDSGRSAFSRMTRGVREPGLSNIAVSDTVSALPQPRKTEGLRSRSTRSAASRLAIRSERRLCEEINLNLAYRWSCRLGLDGDVPDHSTFSKKPSRSFSRERSGLTRPAASERTWTKQMWRVA